MVRDILKNKEILRNVVMSDIYLFTTSHCPACPAAKKYVEEKGIDVIKLEVDTNPEHMLLANQYGVASVPMFVVTNGQGYDKYFLEEFKKLEK